MALGHEEFVSDSARVDDRDAVEYFACDFRSPHLVHLIDERIGRKQSGIGLLIDELTLQRGKPPQDVAVETLQQLSTNAEVKGERARSGGNTTVGAFLRTLTLHWTAFPFALRIRHAAPGRPSSHFGPVPLETRQSPPEAETDH